VVRVEARLHYSGGQFVEGRLHYSGGQFVVPSSATARRGGQYLNKYFFSHLKYFFSRGGRYLKYFFTEKSIAVFFGQAGTLNIFLVTLNIFLVGEAGTLNTQSSGSPVP
jgi:hypothetical protein